MLWRDRLWMKHRHKGDYDFCPLCYAPIKWVYDGIDWIPCDQEPVLIYPHQGKETAVIRRELLFDCKLYSQGIMPNLRPVEALRPHVFTCHELKK